MASLPVLLTCSEYMSSVKAPCWCSCTIDAATAAAWHSTPASRTPPPLTTATPCCCRCCDGPPPPPPPPAAAAEFEGAAAAAAVASLSSALSASAAASNSRLMRARMSSCSLSLTAGACRVCVGGVWCVVVCGWVQLGVVVQWCVCVCVATRQSAVEYSSASQGQSRVVCMPAWGMGGDKTEEG